MDDKTYKASVKRQENDVYKVTIRWPRSKGTRWPFGEIITIRKGTRPLETSEDFFLWGSDVLEVETRHQGYTGVELLRSEVSDKDIFLMQAAGKAEPIYELDTIDYFYQKEVQAVEILAQNLSD